MQQCQRSNPGRTMTLQSQLLTNNPNKYQLSTPYSFYVIAQRDFIAQGHYSKCSYQESHSYMLWFLRYNPDKILPFVSLQQGQKSNKDHTMTLVSTSYILQCPIYSLDKTQNHGHFSKVKGQINVKP